jgi:hypothetical protein
MSGPHLSEAARRARPARQHAVAAWPPCAAPTPRLKSAVGTPRSCRSPPTAASPAPPASRPPRARRHCPDRSPRSRHRPDRRGPKPSTPGSVAVSRRSPLARHRRLRAGEPSFPAVSRAPAPCRRRLVKQRRRAVPPPRARVVRYALRGPAEVGHTSAAHSGHARSADRGCGPCTRAAPAPALCIWAERGFGLVAPG